MAPVDPTVLLNTIVYLLDRNGSLKNDRVVRQFITLMKLAEKLVNKSIYLQILKHTKSEEILRMFLKSNGHQILIKWLSYFSIEHNHAFVLDTLNILGDLPFNIDNVSQNDIDELQLKIVELISTESGKEKDIRESAQHLYDIWSTKGVFKTLNSPIPQLDIDDRIFPQSSSTSQSSILISEQDSLISEKRTLFLSNNNSNKNNSSNDKKMATTATLTAVSGTTSSNNSSTDINKRKSEENIGPSTNRKSTHRRISTQPQTDNTNMKSSIDLDDSDGLNKTNSLNRTSSTFRIPKLERPNTSVPSPPLSTTTEISESLSSNKSGITLNRQTSDELNSQQGKRKFSLSQYKEHKRLKSNELQHNTSADTDMRINNNNNIGNSKSSPSMIIDDELSANTFDAIQSVISPKSNEISKDTIIKSNLSEPGVKKVIKKKVIWADEKNQTLVQTSYFEIDDSELADMHVFARTCAANISIAQLEKVMERDLRKRRGIQDMNSNENDEKQYSTPLPNLIKILLPDSIQIPQNISQERFVQEEREKTVLQALFIRSFLPDSPGEPDGDLMGNNNIERTEPKLIPLEDDTSSSVSSKVTSVNNNNNNLTTTTIPLVSINNTIPITTNVVTPSLSSFSFGDVSPEVAQILAQAKGKLTSATANNLSTTTTATPTNTLINPSTTITSVTSTITNPTVTSTLNLPAPPNLFSALFNVSRPSGNEMSNVPPPPNSLANLLPNLPLNFNLPPPPTPFPLSQLIANALTLGIPPPPPPTGTSSLYQTPTPATFTTPPNLSNPMMNSMSLPPPSSSSSLNSKQPSVRFVSAIGQQTRPNLSNNHEHQMSSSSRENSREHHFRRGPPNNNNNRRDYYQNRNTATNNNNNHNNNNNNNNSSSNNNRNIFS